MAKYGSGRVMFSLVFKFSFKAALSHFDTTNKLLILSFLDKSELEICFYKFPFKMFNCSFKQVCILQSLNFIFHLVISLSISSLLQPLTLFITFYFILFVWPNFWQAVLWTPLGKVLHKTENSPLLQTPTTLSLCADAQGQRLGRGPVWGITTSIPHGYICQSLLPPVWCCWDLCGCIGGGQSSVPGHV